MKQKSIKLLLIFLLSKIMGGALEPLFIIEKAINRLNNQNISFACDLKVQSLSDDPTQINFNFYSYWQDSIKQYNYIKFNSPIDYKNTEVWSYYKDQVLIKKRMPINNKIIKVDSSSENANILKFFNFTELFKSIKNERFSINEEKLNDKAVYVIKSFKPNSGKKSTKLYIDKINFCIYKIEWNNKRGILNKILLFNDWHAIDDYDFPSKIIYEDTKKGLKTSCSLSNIEFNSLSKKNIESIKIGFDNND